MTRRLSLSMPSRNFDNDFKEHMAGCRFAWLQRHQVVG
jgi:hypothetical protein